MIDKLKKGLQQAGDLIKEQAANLGDSALEKTNSLFEQWAYIFPTLDELGLKMQSFSVGVSISPTMEVHLTGRAIDFTPDKLEPIQEKYQDSTILTSVFKTIQTTYELHQKTEAELFEPIHLKITVKISPEIKVILGDPEIF
ncbi:MAG: hypothetical protein AAF985_23050 [Bacteroidota bacterium]